MSELVKFCEWNLHAWMPTAVRLTGMNLPINSHSSYVFPAFRTDFASPVTPVIWRRITIKIVWERNNENVVESLTKLLLLATPALFLPSPRLAVGLRSSHRQAACDGSQASNWPERREQFLCFTAQPYATQVVVEYTETAWELFLYMKFCNQQCPKKPTN